jgi:hypothetical protein
LFDRPKPTAGCSANGGGGGGRRGRRRTNAAAASCKDIARAPVTKWEPHCVTLAGYCYAVWHGMKVQLVILYRVSHLQRYSVTVRGNVISVYPHKMCNSSRYSYMEKVNASGNSKHRSTAHSSSATPTQLSRFTLPCIAGQSSSW